MPITRTELENAYPVLVHISLARGVEQVMRYGLLSTKALLDLCEMDGEARSRIEMCQRPQAVPISHPIHGTFLINDQAPMNAAALERCLIDLTPQQWCESLNSRVFLWPTRQLTSTRRVHPIRSTGADGSGFNRKCFAPHSSRGNGFIAVCSFRNYKTFSTSKVMSSAWGVVPRNCVTDE